MSVLENTLNSNLYCTLATVCEDGSPWASPVFFVATTTQSWTNIDGKENGKFVDRREEIA
jgi:hypothetical protein